MISAGSCAAAALEASEAYGPWRALGGGGWGWWPWGTGGGAGFQFWILILQPSPSVWGVGRCAPMKGRGGVGELFPCRHLQRVTLRERIAPAVPGGSPPSLSPPACRCPSAFFGNRCQLLNPCHSSPCKNAGTCHTSVRGNTVDYTCACRLGFTDRLCLTPEENVCLSSPCRNGGTCELLTLTEYKCRCPPGWSGKAGTAGRGRAKAILRPQLDALPCPFQRWGRGGVLLLSSLAEASGLGMLVTGMKGVECGFSWSGWAVPPRVPWQFSC